METEKVLCIVSLVIAGLLTLVFLLDLALGIPFGRSSVMLDVMFLVAGAFVIWQGIATYKEFA
jgi:hypothetical protein